MSSVPRYSVSRPIRNSLISMMRSASAGGAMVAARFNCLRQTYLSYVPVESVHKFTEL